MVKTWEKIEKFKDQIEQNNKKSKISKSCKSQIYTKINYLKVTNSKENIGENKWKKTRKGLAHTYNLRKIYWNSLQHLKQIKNKM